VTTREPGGLVSMQKAENSTKRIAKASPEIELNKPRKQGKQRK